MRKKCNRTHGKRLKPYREVIKRLHKAGMSTDEIADELGKERTTIIYHLRILKIKPNLKERSNYRKTGCGYIHSNKGRIERLNKSLDDKYPEFKINRGKLKYKEYVEADKNKKLIDK